MVKYIFKVEKSKLLALKLVLILLVQFMNQIVLKISIWNELGPISYGIFTPIKPMRILIGRIIRIWWNKRWRMFVLENPRDFNIE